MTAVHSVTGLCLAVLICQVSLNQAASGRPHSSCRYYSPDLECTESNLEIPTKFDVSQIPTDIRTIRLNCPNSHHAGVYCNTLKRNAQPFPGRAQLHSVALYGFQLDDGAKFLTTALLGNVKQQIDILDIRYSKFTKLDAESFRGFSALKTLIIEGNDLVDIAADTFQFLGARSPILSDISLGSNRIVSFDWSALKPVADSLKDLILSNQRGSGLQTLSRSSSSFSLKKLDTLGLNNNKLKTVPKTVLETLNNYALYSGPYSFKGNPFCPADPNCGCCELKDFFAWVRESEKNAKGDMRLMVDYTCGSGATAKQHLLTVTTAGFDLTTGKPNYINGETAEFNPFPSKNPNTGRDPCEAA
ncbi:uncharacterized protein LOC129588354 [Paramacrobiotus metropolitanus]|uniref:uncharacterized protein LOC129588354 n=1 Tax=Paramacrobiotus metropolitanus TaxID=2943436 RepID=UPI00244605B7|nr:uncharacterized protein LOC129588354 [Paramacrobiotus metropolitanus]